MKQVNRLHKSKKLRPAFRLVLCSVAVIAVGCIATLLISNHLVSFFLGEKDVSQSKISSGQIVLNNTTYNLYPWSYYTEENTQNLSEEEFASMSLELRTADQLAMILNSLGIVTYDPKAMQDLIKDYCKKFELETDDETRTWYVLDGAPLKEHTNEYRIYCMIDTDFDIFSFHILKQDASISDLTPVQQYLTNVLKVLSTTDQSEIAEKGKNDPDLYNFGLPAATIYTLQNMADRNKIDPAYLTLDAYQMIGEQLTHFLYRMDDVFLSNSLQLFDSFLTYDAESIYKQLLLSDSSIRIEKNVLAIPFTNVSGVSPFDSSKSSFLIYIYFDPATFQFCGYHFQEMN